MKFLFGVVVGVIIGIALKAISDKMPEPIEPTSWEQLVESIGKHGKHN